MPTKPFGDAPRRRRGCRSAARIDSRGSAFRSPEPEDRRGPSPSVARARRGPGPLYRFTPHLHVRQDPVDHLAPRDHRQQHRRLAQRTLQHVDPQRAPHQFGVLSSGVSSSGVSSTPAKADAWTISGSHPIQARSAGSLGPMVAAVASARRPHRAHRPLTRDEPPEGACMSVRPVLSNGKTNPLVALVARLSHQVHARRGHAPARARRTHRSRTATERHEELVPATRAPDAREPVPRVPTAQQPPRSSRSTCLGSGLR